MVYRVTKTYGHDLGISAAFRQPFATSHCNRIHGYALRFALTFETNQLDANNWVIDFGSLKPVKEFIFKTFDHKTLIALNDPEFEFIEQMADRKILDMVVLNDGVGCEKFAKYVSDWVVYWLHGHDKYSHVNLTSVEVHEHGGNMAAYIG